METFNGKVRIEFNKRLGTHWHDLADYFDIENQETERFEPGHQGREILNWLEQRNRLNELVEALNYIDRKDLVIDLFTPKDDNYTPNPPKTFSGCPYPGLRAFSEDEANLFFGRKPEIDALFEKIIAGRFLAVIGASGSGKSSLVRAGLIPILILFVSQNLV